MFFFGPFTVANSHRPFPNLYFLGGGGYFYNLIYHVSLDIRHTLLSHLQFSLGCNIKLYKKGLMPEHQKCFILPMHRRRCWKETVVFCAGTCLCNISREVIFIFCFPHCCHFPSASLYFTQRLRATIVLIVENSSSWVLMNVLNEIVWVPHLFCLWLFFFMNCLFYKDTNWGKSLKGHSWRYYNAHNCHQKPQQLSSSCTEVTSGPLRTADL